ncbi:hypothetical protein J6590_103576 [Homalodisca vitripennis]|nr:hypothetical protein J6590_103576 [Homalodisca vitripennis]
MLVGMTVVSKIDLSLDVPATDSEKVLYCRVRGADVDGDDGEDSEPKGEGDGDGVGTGGGAIQGAALHAQGRRSGAIAGSLLCVERRRVLGVDKHLTNVSASSLLSLIARCKPCLVKYFRLMVSRRTIWMSCLAARFSIKTWPCRGRYCQDPAGRKSVA